MGLRMCGRFMNIQQLVVLSVLRQCIGHVDVYPHPSRTTRNSILLQAAPKSLMSSDSGDTLAATLSYPSKVNPRKSST